MTQVTVARAALLCGHNHPMLKQDGVVMSAWRALVCDKATPTTVAVTTFRGVGTAGPPTVARAALLSGHNHPMLKQDGVVMSASCALVENAGARAFHQTRRWASAQRPSRRSHAPGSRGGPGASVAPGAGRSIRRDCVGRRWQRCMRLAAQSSPWLVPIDELQPAPGAWHALGTSSAPEACGPRARRDARWPRAEPGQAGRQNNPIEKCSAPRSSQSRRTSLNP